MILSRWEKSARSGLMFLLLGLVLLPLQLEPQSPELTRPTEITIGFIPLLGPEKTKQKFEPLITHLQKSLGIKVNAIVPESYVNLIDALKNQKIEFALMGPSNYIEAHKITGATAIAIELSPEGKPGYYAIIISSKKSGITTLDQAQGKVFAFTDPESASGFIIPNIYFLRERKQSLASFASRTVLAGSHLAVVEGVAKGTYHLGATNDMDLERACQVLKLKPEQFTILWKSDLIPGCPMVARKDLPVKLKQNFLEALLSLSKKDLALMQSGGFILAQDSDFDYLRELEKYLPR